MIASGSRGRTVIEGHALPGRPGFDGRVRREAGRFRDQSA